jgi:hypothetical protein
MFRDACRLCIMGRFFLNLLKHAVRGIKDQWHHNNYLFFNDSSLTNCIDLSELVAVNFTSYWLFQNINAFTLNSIALAHISSLNVHGGRYLFLFIPRAELHIDIQELCINLVIIDFGSQKNGVLCLILLQFSMRNTLMSNAKLNAFAQRPSRVVGATLSAADRMYIVLLSLGGCRYRFTVNETSFLFVLIDLLILFRSIIVVARIQALSCLSSTVECNALV